MDSTKRVAAIGLLLAIANGGGAHAEQQPVTSLLALVVGAIYFLAYGADLPGSNLRFSRLR